jgi:rSAM/selenodomain-associated transferase 1
MEFPRARILVFAKAPVAGYAKTRLVPFLGEIQAARLQRELITRTLDIATGSGLCPVELWCAPDCEHEYFDRCRTSYDIVLQRQHGQDLGQRMARALAGTLRNNRPVLLIGTDNADLDNEYLRRAIELLATESDVVIGPATDGGYVLIGLNRFIPELFDDIPWSSDQVLAVTRRRLEEHAVDWRELKTCHDIDRPEDLEHLPEPLHAIFCQSETEQWKNSFDAV